MPTEASDFEMYATSPSDMTTTGARNVSTINSKYISTYNWGPTPDNTYDLAFNRSAPCIAMYWKGMEPNKNAIRLDMIRRFNMVPNKEVRDLVEIGKPNTEIDPNETINSLFKVTRSAPFGGHTLREVDGGGNNVMNAIHMNMANSQLLTGDLKYLSIGEYAKALQNGNGGEDGFD